MEAKEDEGGLLAAAVAESCRVADAQGLHAGGAGVVLLRAARGAAAPGQAAPFAKATLTAARATRRACDQPSASQYDHSIPPYSTIFDHIPLGACHMPC